MIGKYLIITRLHVISDSKWLWDYARWITSFFYNVKSEEEAKDIAEGIEKELKPNFSLASWKYTKDKKWKQK